MRRLFKIRVTGLVVMTLACGMSFTAAAGSEEVPPTTPDSGIDERAGVDIEFVPSVPDGLEFPAEVASGADAAPTAGGADAAPSAAQTVFDASQAAADNYYQWFMYEVQVPSDQNRDFQSVVYPDGVAVCGHLALGKSADAIENLLVGTKGYTPSGAAAIYKAAVNALCPHRNLGFMTYFDRNVSDVHTAMVTRFTWTNGTLPPIFAVGWFTKEVCTYLTNKGSTTGLWETLLSMRPGGQYQNYPAAYMVRAAADDITLRRFVNVAVLEGCTGNHFMLGAFYTRA